MRGLLVKSVGLLVWIRTCSGRSCSDMLLPLLTPFSIKHNDISGNHFNCCTLHEMMHLEKDVHPTPRGDC